MLTRAPRCHGASTEAQGSTGHADTRVRPGRTWHVRPGASTPRHRAACTGPRGTKHGAYAVRVPAFVVPYVPRTVAQQAHLRHERRPSRADAARGGAPLS
eukprot:scaffold91715_cov50-Phaeocystis_antarctica.AAC.2